jgi:hypothetical protein
MFEFRAHAMCIILPDLRSSIETLKAQVNILKQSTDFLSSSVGRLQDEVEE